MGKTEERAYLGIEIKLSPADLVALEGGTYVGDPVRTAIQKAADQEDREVDWDTLKTWVNTNPHDHPGITIRVFVKAPRRENEPADD